jgi:hypothetical protein
MFSLFPNLMEVIGVYKTIGNLNKRMKHDTYPLPRVDVHLDMAQGVFFSKMDLLKGILSTTHASR